MTLTINLIVDNRVKNVDILYDHEAEHYISDVPKHSSNGGLNPWNFFLPPYNILLSEF